MFVCHTSSTPALFCRAIAALVLLPTALLSAEPPRQEPEVRALAFLAVEVPRWSRENHCFSCHNNGDAARALYAGLRAGYTIPQAALVETNDWLGRTDRWDHNGGEGPFSDRRLARLQFTTALATAYAAGQVQSRENFLRAAVRLAGDQSPDGSWPLEGENGPGSPTTHGPFLATYLARENLQTADPVRFREAIDRAGRWLAGHEARSIMDVSVALLVLAKDSSPHAAEAQTRCLDRLGKAQTDDGGWGPFATSAPENFDTALALIALAAARTPSRTSSLISRGRGFLIARQRPDGSWIETTRPPGAESYAQRISTTGWAALALIATRDRSPGRPPDLKR